MSSAAAISFALAALSCGLAAFWATLAIRSRRPFLKWAEAGKRPWACDLCMATWTSLVSVVVVAAWWSWWEFCWAWPVAAGAALLTLTIYGRLQQGSNDFVLPEDVQ